MDLLDTTINKEYIVLIIIKWLSPVISYLTSTLCGSEWEVAEGWECSYIHTLG